jgi:hypothetical protein
VSVRIGRRSFLGLLGSGGALATLARVTPAALGPGVVTACGGASDGTLFSPDERDVLTRVVERLVESGESGMPRVRDTDAIARIEGLLAVLDPALVQPLPALLRLVDWGPWLFELTPSRFRSLSGEAQDASLRGWRDSRLALRRQGFAALRNLAFFGWYADDASWPGVGYRGPLLGPGAAP